METGDAFNGNLSMNWLKSNFIFYFKEKPIFDPCDINISSDLCYIAKHFNFLILKKCSKEAIPNKLIIILIFTFLFLQSLILYILVFKY